MCFVDDNRERLSAFCLDFVHDDRKFLHRRNDDLFSLLDELAQVARALGMTNGGTHLHELLDGRLNLAVEDAPVSNYDDRVEHLFVIALEPNELVRQPRDGVRLAAPRRVLNQVTSAGAMFAHVSQRLPYEPELVESRPYLPPLLFAGLGVLLLDDLRVVLKDICQPCRREDLFPQVVGLESVRIWRVACAIVVSRVEGQEPGALTS